MMRKRVLHRREHRFGGGVFDAPAGYRKVKLVYNGTTLYECSSAALEPLTAGIGTFAPGGSLTIDKTLTTPVIPPKPDVVFLADTTGSMQSALDNGRRTSSRS
jgi:hypothetical protein